MDYDNLNTGENTKPEQPIPRKRNWFGFIFGVVAVVGFFVFTTMAPTQFPEGETIFTVAPGQSLKSVATQLEKAGYIRSRTFFSTLVIFYGQETTIPAGDYLISGSKNVFTLARQIASGTHNIAQIKITIPEGQTVVEIEKLLSRKIPNFDSSRFVSIAQSYEGYLYPETYFIYPKTNPDDVVTEMRSMFERQTQEILSSENLAGRSKSDVVILASLIEREARGSDDRAVIAGILTNRLKIGMRLQVDATVAYAVGKFDRALQKSDFTVDSPYNTYLYKGLPPGPIANPGNAALTAAIYPSKTPYLYYLHDKNGTIHYARTYNEHLANIRKYLK